MSQHAIHLESEIKLLDTSNTQLSEEINSLRKSILSEHQKYADLIQDFEIEKFKNQQTLCDKDNQLKEKIIECEKLQAELEQQKHLTIASKNTYQTQIKKLKAQIITAKEEMIQKKPEKERWYAEQIVALEADRDMFYYRCNSLQEEITCLTQEYENCLREKDSAIEDIRQNLEQAQIAIREWANKFNIQSIEKNRISKQLLTKDSHIQTLQKELEIIDKQNLSIWRRFDEELTGLQCRMDCVRNISTTGKHLLTGSSHSPVPLKTLINNSSPHTISGMSRELSSPIIHKVSSATVLSPIESPVLQLHVCDNEVNSPQTEQKTKEDLQQVQVFSSAVKKMENKIQQLETDNNLLNTTIENMSIEFRLKTEQIRRLENALEALRLSSQKELEQCHYKLKNQKQLELENLQQDKLLLHDQLESMRQQLTQLNSEQMRNVSDYKTVQNMYKTKISTLKQECLMLRAQIDDFAKEKSCYERKIASMVDEKQDCAVKLFLANK
jgi:chromosome segregation ATPase